MSGRDRLRYIGAAVAEVRRNHGASPEEMATGAGLTPDVLEAIERADHDPSVLILVDLTEVVLAPLLELLQPSIASAEGS